MCISSQYVNRICIGLQSSKFNNTIEKEKNMKLNRSFRTAGVCLMVMVLFLTLPVFAGNEVPLVGKLNNGGKGIVDDAGKQYKIVPAEEIFRDLKALDGQRVELTGVVYVSHGKNMITALSFKKVK
jgi:hypothetical protein